MLQILPPLKEVFMSQNLTTRKPTTLIKTKKVSVNIYDNSDGTVTITTGLNGGKGKGRRGGHYGGKTTIPPR